MSLSLSHTLFLVSNHCLLFFFDEPTNRPHLQPLVLSLVDGSYNIGCQPSLLHPYPRLNLVDEKKIATLSPPRVTSIWLSSSTSSVATPSPCSSPFNLLHPRADHRCWTLPFLSMAMEGLSKILTLTLNHNNTIVSSTSLTHIDLIANLLDWPLLHAIYLLHGIHSIDSLIGRY